jgi:toxin ParE1/3/4
VARIELATEVGDDVERILEHLAQYQVRDAAQRIQEIIQAIAVLEHSPQIGRPTDNGLRELVIGHRSRGYVALYRYSEELDTVFVLALRGQKEAGYGRGDE